MFPLAETTATLTPETWVPLGIAVVCAIAIIGLIITLMRKANDVLNRLERIEERLGFGWTVSRQKIWELELQRRNPAIQVPDSFEIVRGDRKE